MTQSQDGRCPPLNSDIILLEEVRAYDVAARLPEAMAPHTYHVPMCSEFREPVSPGLGKQQVAILAKVPAQGAWSETWKAMSGVDFNANLDQPEFAQEKTLVKLTAAGFHNS